MSDIQHAYDHWSTQYDTNENKTRDLEAIALQKTLSSISFQQVLELGCGTGKNSGFLIQNAKQVLAVDFSEEMMNKAKLKISSDKITFKQGDITLPWNFTHEKFDLISFSLILEHINDLDFIFKEIKNHITDHGFVYIGEIHPFKQYIGGQARFQTRSGTHLVRAYVHHISEFLNLSRSYGFSLIRFHEWFDDDNLNSVPRILSLLFQHQNR